MAKTEVIGIDNVYLKDGCVRGLKLKVSYDVTLDDGTKCKVAGALINLDGMPIKRMALSAWANLRIQRQTVERACNDKKTVESFSGKEISWALVGRKIVSEEELFTEAVAATSTLSELAKLRLAVKTMLEAGMNPPDEILAKIRDLEKRQEPTNPDNRVRRHEEG